MSDRFKRINTLVMYPPFLEKCKQLVKNLECRGEGFYALSGERTWEEQQALYDQGRTKPGKIVTKARPGQSCHNFAIAMDLCADKDEEKPGLQPDWRVPEYKVLAEEAEALGLEAGYNWKKFPDSPHVQLPLRKHGITLAKLREVYKTGGKKAVFKFLDQYEW